MLPLFGANRAGVTVLWTNQYHLDDFNEHRKGIIWLLISPNLCPRQICMPTHGKAIDAI
jgi:hypothetical protein